MPALSINDLNNGKRDLDHIGDIATSKLPAAVDRLGKSKPTVIGAVNSLKAFNSRGAFVAGAAYAMKDVYVSGGIAYVAVIDHVGSTVAADLAAGNVVVHQGATREDLALGTGSAGMGFMQDELGAVRRTVEAVLRSAFSISISNYMTDQQLASVLAGADATIFLQAAIDALPEGGRMHGSGATFPVTSLKLKSRMSMSNFSLKTKDGAVDFASPITIDGRITPKTDIYLFDVNVDGNRANQSSIDSPVENGGRHCIRLIGTASNIFLERVTGNYSAGDGLEIFSSTSATADDSHFVFNNIHIRDCAFLWNPRHGMSADSVKRLYMDTIELKWNGLDLNNVDALNHGNRGSRSAGKLYGNGIDFEGYGLGSSFSEVHMTRVTGLYNARQGCLYYDAVETRGAGFVARSKIWISDCYFDEGQDASRSGEALTFSSTITSKALAPLYDSIYISNTRLDGYFLARCARNVQFDGEIRTTTTAERPLTAYALLDHASDVVLDVVPAGNVKAIYTDTSTYSLGNEAVPTPANPTLAQVGGPAGALTNVVCTLLENVRDRTCRFLIRARWTAAAAGVPVFSVTPAAGGTLAAPPRVDIINVNNGLAVLASYDLSINSVRFNDPATAPLNFQVIVDVKV